MFRLINEYRRRWEEFAPQLRRLYLFSALQQLGLGASGLVLILRLSRLGWSELQIAQLAAVGLAAGALVALPAGLAVGRVGARRSVIAASLALSLTAALKAVATAPAALTALAAVDGACLAVLYTAYGPLLFEITHPKERSIAYSLDFFLVSLCTPGGAMLAGMALQRSQAPYTFAGTHALSLITATAALVMAFATLPLLALSEPTAPAGMLRSDAASLSYALTEAEPSSVANSVAAGVATAGRGRLWFAAGLQLLSALLSAAAIAHLQPVAVIYLNDGLHFGPAAIGRINGAIAVLGSLLVLTTPLLTRRTGLRGALLFMQLTTTLTLAVMAIFPGNLMPTFAYLLWAAAVQSTGPLRERLLLEAWPHANKAIASGSLYALQNGGGALGAIAGGIFTARGGFGLGLLVAAALSLASLTILPLLPALHPQISRRRRTARASVTGPSAIPAEAAVRNRGSGAAIVAAE